MAESPRCITRAHSAQESRAEGVSKVVKANFPEAEPISEPVEVPSQHVGMDGTSISKVEHDAAVVPLLSAGKAMLGLFSFVMLQGGHDPRRQRDYAV